MQVIFENKLNRRGLCKWVPIAAGDRLQLEFIGFAQMCCKQHL